MKQLLMLYPIEYYVNFDPRLAQGGNAFGYDRVKRFWTKTVTMGITPEEFDQRFRLINRLIDTYRQEGYKVNWALFGKEDQKEQADTSLLSSLFEIHLEDKILSVDISYDDLMKAPHIYPEEKKVLQKLGTLSELTVGGFHSSDCVSRFVHAAHSQGIFTEMDLLLTEQFFYRMQYSLEEDMTQFMLQNASMIDEDADPEEEKKKLFEGRLNAFL